MIAVVVALAGVAGCGASGVAGTSAAKAGSSAKPASSVTPAPSATSAPSASPDGSADRGSKASELEQARKLVWHAARNLERADTGVYHAAVHDPKRGGPVQVSEEGRYRLSSREFEIARTYRIDGHMMRVAFKFIGDAAWMRVTAAFDQTSGYTSWPCWVNLADHLDEPPWYAVALSSFESISGEIVLPGALMAALRGVGRQKREYSGGRVRLIEGAVELGPVAGVLGTLVLANSGADPNSRAPVPGHFLISEAGMLLSYGVDVADLGSTIQRVGGVEDSELTGSPHRIGVSFYRVGESVEIEPPPPGNVVSPAPGEDPDAAGRACAGVAG